MNELCWIVIVIVVFSLFKDVFIIFMLYVLIFVFIRFDYGLGKYVWVVFFLLG